jgi:DNA-binding CsgD family transcriptional regulator
MMSGSEERFVGRQGELAQLRTALEAARSGRGRLALLAGEPGIGKSSTAAEMARHAEADGALVLWGRCHEEAGAPPYWPWTQVLRGLVAAAPDETLRDELGPGAPDVAELLPELRARFCDLGPVATPSDPAAARFRLFASLARFLLAAAQRRPLVVILDDLHWADAPSLRFLRFLAPDIGGGSLLLIGTYRENALSRQHPLSDVLGDLARVPHTVRVRLAGLPVEDVADLVAIAAGADPPPALVHSIHAQTEGNPLFLREVLRHLRERGLLGGAAGTPRPGAPEAIRIPEGVREVIGQRLNLLSPDCNAVLKAAAVIGREFSLDVLLRSCGAVQPDVVLQAVDDAIAARLVEEIRAGHCQFTHALVRMTLYDELRTGERRRLHRAVGEAIEAMHRHALDAVLPELARHFQQAGDGSSRAVDYAMRAGASAEAVLAFEDAVEFFQAALEMVEQQHAPDPRMYASVLLRLGDAQHKTNDFDRARETFRAAAEAARRAGLADLFADAAVGLELANWRIGHGRPGTDSLIREALAGLPATEAARRIKCMGALARAQLYAGAVREAKAIMLDAVALARELGDPGVTARALSILIEFSAMPDEAQALLAASTEMAAMAERAGDLDLLAQASHHCAASHLELGQMGSCVQGVQAMMCAAKQIRQPIYFLFITGLRTSLALLRGDLVEAERLILEGLRLKTPNTAYSADPLSVLIFALRREQGRLGEVGPLIKTFTSQQDSAIWRPGLALLHVELGELDAARALFAAMASDGFAAMPRDGRWTTCLTYLTEIAAALNEAHHAGALYPLLLPHAGRNIVFGNGCGCPGAADRFLGLLAATMGRWPDAERHFAAAEAMNQRTGALAPLAHTRRDFATMLLRRAAPGDAARARQLLEQALSEARRLGLLSLAGRAEAQLVSLERPADPDALTPREAEVLELIAMGRSNADIGLVLAIGVNTVATHVRSVLAKTGCANRTEAAAYALRQRAGQRA